MGEEGLSTYYCVFQVSKTSKLSRVINCFKKLVTKRVGSKLIHSVLLMHFQIYITADVQTVQLYFKEGILKNLALVCYLNMQHE